MHKWAKTLSLLTILTIAGAFAYPLFSLAAAPGAIMPFGGMVLFIFYCDEGILVDVGPPVGGTFIWTYSTISYLYGPPYRIGQWLLGLIGPEIACTIDGEPYDYGNVILFHGSSL